MRDRATLALTTVVVDDEQLACDELAYLLKDFPDVDVIATGSNGLQAVQLIRKLEPELVFLTSTCRAWTAWAWSASSAKIAKTCLSSSS
jgi:DNA-binding NarL/FixJ family response regulator